MTKEVILASASPRRVELIKKIPWLKATVFPSNCDETLSGKYSGENAAVFLANLKADYVLNMFNDKTVIGADTIVCLGNVLLGKPKDDIEALKMFKMLCGTTHSVITGVCIASKVKKVIFFEKTLVTFNAFNDNIVYNYIKSGAHLDKAGGYGIQDEQLKQLISAVDGDYDNVIGLPVLKLEKALMEF